MSAPVLKQRRGTAAAMAAANELPAAGQIYFELDTNRVKIGDGSRRYNDLPYLDAKSIAQITGLQAALDAKVADTDPRLTDARTPTAHTHDDRYYTETEANALLAAKVDGSDPRLSDSRDPTPHSHDASNITTGTLLDARLSANVVLTDDSRLTDARTPTAHTHDDRYYTETETDTLLSGKASSSDPRLTDARTPTAHTHDDRYYTETETDTLLSGKASSSDPRLTDARTPTAHTHPLTEISQSGATTGQVPTWSGSAWVASTPASGGGNSFTGGTLSSQLLVIPGTASGPGLAISGDPNTGLAQLTANGANTLSVVTDGAERLLVRSDGAVGLGTVGSAPWALHIGRDMSADGGQILVGGNVPASVTSGNTHGVFAQISTAANSAATNIYHFFVNENPAARLGSVTNQYGYYVASSLTGASGLNIGFRSDIASGTNRYNFYAAGTAANYFNGTTTFPNGIVTGAGSGGASLAFSFVSDSNTGIWSPLADTIAFVTGGSDRFLIDSTGNVGIGTIAPACPLDVVRPEAGSGAAFSVSRASTFQSNGTGQRIDVQPATSGSSGVLISHSSYLSNVITVRNGMRFTDGYVRIEDGSGAFSVSVNTSTKATELFGQLTVTTGSGSAGSYLPAVVFSGDPNTGIQQIGGADSFSIVTGGFERLKIDSLGRCQLSTGSSDISAYSSGMDDLIIGDGAGGRGLIISSGSTDFCSVGFTKIGASSSGYVQYRNGLDYLRFGTASVERMRISSTGNVGIGLGDADATSLLHVNGTARITSLTDGTTTRTVADLLACVKQTDIDNSIANLVDSAPATLNTLNELAAALNDDPSFATTVTNAIAAKVGSSTAQAGGGTAVNNLVVMTQAAYDGLATKDSNTVYLVT